MLVLIRTYDAFSNQNENQNFRKFDNLARGSITLCWIGSLDFVQLLVNVLSLMLLPTGSLYFVA